MSNDRPTYMEPYVLMNLIILQQLSGNPPKAEMPYCTYGVPFGYNIIMYYENK